MQNDSSPMPSVKQRIRERKKYVLQAKVIELEDENNKIAIRNEIFQEQYKELFGMLYEARKTRSHEPIALMTVDHHVGTP